MTRRLLTIVCCVLVSATPMLAQSHSAKPGPDPISGTWKGELKLSKGEGTQLMPITLVLKFDGKSAVTGTAEGLPNPADVKAGTFDPKKGTLKLQLGKKGDGAVLLVLDGTVAKGTASGRFSGDESGDFKITKTPAKAKP